MLYLGRRRRAERHCLLFVLPLPFSSKTVPFLVVHIRAQAPLLTVSQPHEVVVQVDPELGLVDLTEPQQKTPTISSESARIRHTKNFSKRLAGVLFLKTIIYP